MENKSYKDMLEESVIHNYYLTYQDKLLTIEWNDKRVEILSRDKHKCTKCGEPKVIQFGKGYREKTQSEKDKYWDEISRIPDLPNFVTKEKIIYHKEPVDLHVHHKYYIQNKLPWEYVNEALVTLCDLCHQKTHLTETIPVYADESKSELLNFTRCNTCNGSGYLGHYKYYKNGICFNCSGTGYIELK